MKNRNYLNDYKMTASGEYIYTGKRYVPTVDGYNRKVRILLLLSLLIASLVIGSGYIDGAGMINSFYVILPFIAEVGCVFFLLWNTIRLVTAKSEIKEYVYTSVMKKIPDASKALMFFSAFSAAASVVFFILNRRTISFDYTVLYPVIKLVVIAVDYFFIRQFGKLSFTEK